MLTDRKDMPVQTIKTFDYTPIPGWSVSRYDVFLTCKRRYYYNYYAKYDKDYPLWKIQELKKLTSFPLEVGNIVHDTIKALLKRLLKSEDEIDTTRFLDFAREKTINYKGYPFDWRSYKM